MMTPHIQNLTHPHALLLALALLPAIGKRGEAQPPEGVVSVSSVATTLPSPSKLPEIRAEVYRAATCATGLLERLGERGRCNTASAVLVETPPELKPLVPEGHVLILTAAHVVTNPSCKDSFVISFFETPPVEEPPRGDEWLFQLNARVITYSGAFGFHSDAAFMVAPLPENPDLARKILDRRLTFADRDPAEFDFLEAFLSVGFPGAKFASIIHWHLGTTPTKHGGLDTMLSGQASEGHSGGSVVDRDGKLVGVVSSGGKTERGTIDYILPGAERLEVEGDGPTALRSLAEKKKQLQDRVVPRFIQNELGRTTIETVSGIRQLILATQSEYDRACDIMDERFKTQEELLAKLKEAQISPDVLNTFLEQLRLALQEESDRAFMVLGWVPEGIAERSKNFGR